ncbi:MAG TPA: branched-chain amino acid ABC transporter permease [Acidimicrobiia bacterium]|nr:branched-chain amino acid ABC transporter permease [Acidimicrobiia bacterium]
MTDLILIFAQATTRESHLAAAISEGLSLGAIYALLAMGFVIIFKATQVLNFAHGALAALGAFLVASFATLINFPGRFLPETIPHWLRWSLSALCALIAAALVGMLLERIFIRPMVGEELFAVAIVTLGIDIALRNITNDFIGTDPRPLGDPWGTKILDLGWVTFAHTEVAQILVSIVLVSAVALFFRSRTGIAMRATAFDQEAARAQGINVGRIFSISWAIGAVLAAVAGIFVSVFPRRSAGVDTATAFFAFKALPAIILGGLDSVVGAVVGGFGIGLAEAFVGEYVSFSFLGSGFAGIVPYLVMLLVLIVKPYGLFGTEEIRRV